MRRPRIALWCALFVLLSAETASAQFIYKRPSDFFTGTVRPVTTCTQAAFETAYGLAVDRDIIAVNGGCTITFSSYTTVTKKIMIRGGEGGGTTTISISAGDRGLQMQTGQFRITGFTFDCNFANTSNAGIIRVGSSSANPAYEYGDWRIDSNVFQDCGASGGNTTGFEAITAAGFLYGVIDHNIFNDCNGECLNICADGVRGLTRAQTFGGYANGTVFVEDNVWNHNRSGILYENVIDGNSSQRFTFRYNTINVANGAILASGVISTHETCVTCTGSSTDQGDAGSVSYEMYENTIQLNATGSMRDLGIVRGGKALIYNNHILHGGSISGRVDVGSWLSNYRSIKAYGATPTDCHLATNIRGYSGACHEFDSGFTSEGRDFTKTTLNGAINSSQAPVLTSVTGIATNGTADGFSIMIGTEQIDYTGISGNTLTGVTRGANHTTAASHSNGAAVDYLKFGICLEQTNNVSIWNNDINGSVGSSMNDVFICGWYPGGGNECAGETAGGPDYTDYDIQDFTVRPNNWQYKLGVAYSYTPHPYPHPLQSSTGPG